MNELDFSQYPDELLRSLSPSQIIELRKLMAGNQAAQNRLSSVDHRMFTRDAAATEGPLAALGIGLVSPFYQMKKLGDYKNMEYQPPDNQTSEPSWQQFIEGYKGLGEGLGDWAKNKADGYQTSVNGISEWATNKLNKLARK